MNKKALTFTIAMLLVGTSMGPIPKLTSYANINEIAENNAISKDTISESNNINKDTTIENNAISKDTTSESNNISKDTAIENNAIVKDTTSESNNISKDTAIENNAIVKDTTSEDIVIINDIIDNDIIENSNTVNNSAGLYNIDVNNGRATINLSTYSNFTVTDLNRDIQNAFNNHDSIQEVVIISNDNNPISIQGDKGIIIHIPEDKKLTWKAKIHSNRVGNGLSLFPLITLNGNGTFILDDNASIVYESPDAISSNGSVNMIVKNGLVHARLLSAISWNSAGTFTMNGGTVQAEYTAILSNGGDFIINGGIIQANETPVELHSNNNFTMNGGEIKAFRRHAVSMRNGTFTMNGGTINAFREHAVSMRNGTFTMNDGTIEANNQTIHLSTHSPHFIIENGGQIKASTDMAVFTEAGNFTMKNGLIESPTKTILWKSNGNFIMDGGEVKAIDINNPYNKAIICEAGKIYLNQGFILGFNKSNEILSRNSSSLIDITSAANNDSVHISDSAKILAFQYQGYIPFLDNYYLEGSSTHLLSKNIKAIWGEEGILVEDKPIITLSDYPGIKTYKLHLPNSIKYKESTVEPKLPEQNVPYFGKLITKYYKEGESTPLYELPTLPGKYHVTVKIEEVSIAPNLLPPNAQNPVIKYIPTEEISLGSFEIQKRNIILTPNDASIKVNEPLPEFHAILSGDEMANGDNLGNYKVLVDTDGKTGGRFDIKVKLLNDGNYNPEGYHIELKTGILTVLEQNVTPQNPIPQNPTPPNHGSGNNGNSNSGGRSGGRSGSGSTRRSGGGSGSGNTKATNPKHNETKGTWISDSKGWQFKNENGTFAKDTWQEISFNHKKDWYFFKNDGYMNTGWLLWNGNWYFLNETSDGNMVKGSMATGWKLISGKWYYFYDKSEGNISKGSMAKSTTINGYKVDENGAWIK